MNFLDIFLGEGETYLTQKIVITTGFQKLLLGRMCEDKDKFNILYESLVNEGIISKGNNFIFFNQSDYFVPDKEKDLENILKNIYHYDKCTTDNILKFYQEQTTTVNNIINKYGGNKSKKRRKSRVTRHSNKKMVHTRRYI
jgi:hypothetical protein